MSHLPPYISRMDDLAAAALRCEDGILVLQPSKPDAIRNRQRFFSARRDLLRKQPYSTASLTKVETSIVEKDGNVYWKIFPANLPQKMFTILDAKTLEPVSIEEKRPEQYEDEVFELMIELAEERKTSKELFERLRPDAERLWSEGRRARGIG